MYGTMDSRCRRHMTGCRSFLSDYVVSDEARKGNYTGIWDYNEWKCGDQRSPIYERIGSQSISALANYVKMATLSLSLSLGEQSKTKMVESFFAVNVPIISTLSALKRSFTQKGLF